MSIQSYIDLRDLLILSYYNRVLCINNNGDYVIVNPKNCPYYRKNLRKLIELMKSSINFGKNSGILVELDSKDIDILHQWGHGLNEKCEQVYHNGKPLFCQNNGMMRGKEMIGGADQLEYKQSAVMSGAVKTALRILVKSLTIGASVGAIVATSGAAGDTIVEAISSTISSGLFFAELMQVIATASSKSKYLKDIFAIRFNEGPEKVHDETIKVLKRMVDDGQTQELGFICSTLLDLLDSVGMVIGDWISTFIPDDAGVVGTIVETIITTTQKESYKTLVNLFNMVPGPAKELLMDRNKLKKFLLDILNAFEQILTQDDQSASLSGFATRFVKSAMASAIPGMRMLQRSGFDQTMFQQIFKIIKQYYEPNIERAVSVLEIVLPLGFAILTVNEFCVDDTQLERLRTTSPISTPPISTSNKTSKRTSKTADSDTLGLATSALGTIGQLTGNQKEIGQIVDTLGTAQEINNAVGQLRGSVSRRRGVDSANLLPSTGLIGDANEILNDDRIQSILTGKKSQPKDKTQQSLVTAIPSDADRTRRTTTQLTPTRGTTTQLTPTRGTTTKLTPTRGTTTKLTPTRGTTTQLAPTRETITQPTLTSEITTKPTLTRETITQPTLTSETTMQTIPTTISPTNLPTMNMYPTSTPPTTAQSMGYVNGQPIIKPQIRGTLYQASPFISPYMQSSNPLIYPESRGITQITLPPTLGNNPTTTYPQIPNNQPTTYPQIPNNQQIYPQSNLMQNLGQSTIPAYQNPFFTSNQMMPIGINGYSQIPMYSNIQNSPYLLTVPQPYPNQSMPLYSGQPRTSIDLNRRQTEDLRKLNNQRSLSSGVTDFNRSPQVNDNIISQQIGQAQPFRNQTHDQLNYNLSDYIAHLKNIQKDK